MTGADHQTTYCPDCGAEGGAHTYACDRPPPAPKTTEAVAFVLLLALRAIVVSMTLGLLFTPVVHTDWRPFTGVLIVAALAWRGADFRD